MKLLLIRHASALDLAEMPAAERTDAKRPLSREGKDEMKQAARGLSKILKRIDYIISSPYTRALETAQIVGEAFPEAELTTLPMMGSAEDKDDLLSELDGYAGEQIAALVGHEPDLSYLLMRLVSDSSRPFMGFKKGSVAMIQFEGRPQWGRGLLVWHMTASMLRKVK